MYSLSTIFLIIFFALTAIGDLLYQVPTVIMGVVAGVVAVALAVRR